ncbi:Uncharacterised protein [Mycoplasmopsis maculosa]|uniref:Uncharacterized protein n=1 Tax=Mycoplasmopsis maculosa TaxID=114885 RepID=A0A449B4N0_9BACT|nr:hypothetical protein [Mycoplasmopsis maculosa]VEU75561.1 Uncharacterised protein [Mycoplasmopsis maculosa]
MKKIHKMINSASIITLSSFSIVTISSTTNEENNNQNLDQIKNKYIEDLDSIDFDNNLKIDYKEKINSSTTEKDLNDNYNTGLRLYRDKLIKSAEISGLTEAKINELIDKANNSTTFKEINNGFILFHKYISDLGTPKSFIITTSITFSLLMVLLIIGTSVWLFKKYRKR